MSNSTFLAELESILANQEDLDKQMSNVSLKEEEKALFTKKRAPQGQDKGVRRYKDVGELSERRQPRWQQEQHRQGSSRGGAHQTRGEQDERRYHPQEDRCYKCDKKWHFARDCKSSQVEGNVDTFTNNDTEEEWDFQASFAIEENDQEIDVEVPTSCPVELLS